MEGELEERLPDGAAVMKEIKTGEWVAFPNFIGSRKRLGPFETKQEAVDAVREARNVR